MELDREFLIEEPKELKVRLDKWLWAARFFKTRALARAAIEKGNVFYNGENVNPGIEIELDAEIYIKQGSFSKRVLVTGLSTRRKNAENALNLYSEMQIINDAHFGIAKPEFKPQKPKKSINFLRRASQRKINNNNFEHY